MKIASKVALERKSEKISSKIDATYLYEIALELRSRIAVIESIGLNECASATARIFEVVMKSPQQLHKKIATTCIICEICLASMNGGDRPAAKDEIVLLRQLALFWRKIEARISSVMNVRRVAKTTTQRVKHIDIVKAMRQTAHLMRKIVRRHKNTFVAQWKHQLPLGTIRLISFLLSNSDDGLVQHATLLAFREVIRTCLFTRDESNVLKLLERTRLSKRVLASLTKKSADPSSVAEGHRILKAMRLLATSRSGRKSRSRHRAEMTEVRMQNIRLRDDSTQAWSDVDATNASAWLGSTGMCITLAHSDPRACAIDYESVEDIKIYANPSAIVLKSDAFQALRGKGHGHRGVSLECRIVFSASNVLHQVVSAIRQLAPRVRVLERKRTPPDLERKARLDDLNPGFETHPKNTSSDPLADVSTVRVDDSDDGDDNSNDDAAVNSSVARRSSNERAQVSSETDSIVETNDEEMQASLELLGASPSGLGKMSKVKLPLVMSRKSNADVPPAASSLHRDGPAKDPSTLGVPKTGALEKCDIDTAHDKTAVSFQEKEMAESCHPLRSVTNKAKKIDKMMPTKRLEKAGPAKGFAKTPSNIKGPRTAYHFFQAAQRNRIREEEGLSGRDLQKAVSTKWKSIDSQTKRTYDKMANADKIRYREEVLARNTKTTANASRLELTPETDKDNDSRTVVSMTALEGLVNDQFDSLDAKKRSVKRSSKDASKSKAKELHKRAKRNETTTTAKKSFLELSEIESFEITEKGRFLAKLRHDETERKKKKRNKENARRISRSERKLDANKMCAQRAPPMSRSFVETALNASALKKRGREPSKLRRQNVRRKYESLDIRKEVTSSKRESAKLKSKKVVPKNATKKSKVVSTRLSRKTRRTTAARSKSKKNDSTRLSSNRIPKDRVSSPSPLSPPPTTATQNDNDISSIAASNSAKSIFEIDNEEATFTDNGSNPSLSDDGSQCVISDPRLKERSLKVVNVRDDGIDTRAPNPTSNCKVLSTKMNVCKRKCEREPRRLFAQTSQSTLFVATKNERESTEAFSLESDSDMSDSLGSIFRPTGETREKKFKKCLRRFYRHAQLHLFLKKRSLIEKETREMLRLIRDDLRGDFEAIETKRRSSTKDVVENFERDVLKLSDKSKAKLRKIRASNELKLRHDFEKAKRMVDDIEKTLKTMASSDRFQVADRRFQKSVASAFSSKIASIRKKKESDAKRFQKMIARSISGTEGE
eukprot:g243.t1